MQGVAEKDNAPDVAEAALRGDHRGDASTHRLAPYEDSPGPALVFGSHGGHRSSPGRFEHVWPVGYTSLRVGVEKVERDDLDSSGRDRVRHGHHPGMALRCPGSVAEHEGDLRL